MRRTIGLTIVLAFAASLVAVAQVGGKAKVDPRLRRALSASDLKYTEMSTGDFRLHFTLDKGRTQLVFAESKTQTMGVLEVREVWSIGWSGEKEPSASVANRLLRDNGRRKVGAWELIRLDGKYHAIFNVKVSADADGDALKAIVFGVASSADDMEKELLNSDEF
jgi:hypothetical protein